MKKNLHFLLTATIVFPAFFSSAQVTKLANNNNIQAGMTLGTKAVLVDDKDSLWVTDGTAAGTTKYAPNVKLDTSLSVVFYKNKIYFAGQDTSRGSELWVTNGTAAGTKLIKNIYSGKKSSAPRSFFVFKNVIYFFASTAENGKELWKSDGTAAGTVLVKDINPGAGSSYINSTYFFTNNSILYFVANHGTYGAELWKTDGTSGGTVLVKDINPNAGSSNPSGFTPLGNLVIFSADNGTTGQELWKTDGTSAGTQLVKDIASSFPGLGSSPSQFFKFKNKLYFTAIDFITYGIEMWVTDGTTAGTTLVKDINPGVNSGAPLLVNAVIFNNKFCFSATSSANGTELWSSNGTAAGTTLLKDINPGTASSSPLIMPDYVGGDSSGGPHKTLFKGKIFFQANNGTTGTELWITGGTEANTKLVKDIRPGSPASLPSDFNYFYTTTNFYFSANDGSTGLELWQSNGTGGGTKIVKDINPGATGSAPFLLYVILNNQLLFTANNGDNAKSDLYKINALVDPLPLEQENAVASIAPDGRLFYIYPNPVQNKLSVVINNTTDKKASIVITDQKGRQLFSQQLSNVKGRYEYNVDIHSYTPGVYYLELITDKGIKTEKFIKN